MASKTIDVGNLRETIQEVLPEIVALRHELHQHPEIRWEEEWTSDRVAAFLTEAGVPFTRGHARGTGIVAVIEGRGSRVVGLRTDMDALEIEEATNLPYASTIPQRMHACGHDGHMANLCGVAKVLTQYREQLSGTVKLIFQPAEENAGGGRYIVEEGILNGMDAVFGMHCWPTLPVGVVGVKDGAAMASADFFQIDVVGKGCHGADPGAGVDPIVVASHITTALQSIVSREVDPWQSAVISVTQIDSGFALNVIPERAKMQGTFRALNDKVRQKVFEAIPRIAENTALAHRATAEVTFPGTPYPVLHNDLEQTNFARRVIADSFGDGGLHELRFPTMGAEDFAFYLQKVPGTFVFLGNNPSQTEPYPNLHSPHFDFNDDALPQGIELLSTLAMRSLAG